MGKAQNRNNMIRWSWKDKLGTFYVKNREGQKCVINIYQGNCLCVLINEYKDEENKAMYNLYNFVADVAHYRQCIKNGHDIFADAHNIKLNLFYKESQTLVKELTKQGHEVKVFYKEPKKESK